MTLLRRVSLVVLPFVFQKKIFGTEEKLTYPLRGLNPCFCLEKAMS